MKKKIEDYLQLPYTRELIPELEGGWFVRIKELPGCISRGATPEEAMQMIGDALRGWLEVSLGSGERIPEPREEGEYSGKFMVRLPRSLHKKLVELAQEEEVSLNQYITTILASAVNAPACIWEFAHYNKIEHQTEFLPEDRALYSSRAKPDAIDNSRG